MHDCLPNKNHLVFYFCGYKAIYIFNNTTAISKVSDKAESFNGCLASIPGLLSSIMQSFTYYFI